MLDSLVTEEGPRRPRGPVRDAMLRAAGGYPMALELFVATGSPMASGASPSPFPRCGRNSAADPPRRMPTGLARADQKARRAGPQCLSSRDSRPPPQRYDDVSYRRLGPRRDGRRDG